MFPTTSLKKASFSPFFHGIPIHKRESAFTSPRKWTDGRGRLSLQKVAHRRVSRLIVSSLQRLPLEYRRGDSRIARSYTATKYCTAFYRRLPLENANKTRNGKGAYRSYATAPRRNVAPLLQAFAVRKCKQDKNRQGSIPIVCDRAATKYCAAFCRQKNYQPLLPYF